MGIHLNLELKCIYRSISRASIWTLKCIKPLVQVHLYTSCRASIWSYQVHLHHYMYGINLITPRASTIPVVEHLFDCIKCNYITHVQHPFDYIKCIYTTPYRASIWTLTSLTNKNVRVIHTMQNVTIFHFALYAHCILFWDTHIL